MAHRTPMGLVLNASVGFPASAGNPATTRSKGQQGAKASSAGQEDPFNLSADAQRQVEKLKKIDQEVRNHEAAHMAAGAGLVRGGASFSYQRGPDGRNYAVGGEVSIDTSAVPGDPSATLRKAQQIKAAALAPQNPSPQDRTVAASADSMAAQAGQELAAQRSRAMAGRQAYTKATPEPPVIDLQA